MNRSIGRRAPAVPEGKAGWRAIGAARLAEEPPFPGAGLTGLASESMATLCPDAFAVNPSGGSGREGSQPGNRLIDPAGRLANAREVDERTARLEKDRRPQRVLSAVVCSGAGSEAYGSSPVDVVVPGFREGASRYFIERAGR